MNANDSKIFVKYHISNEQESTSIDQLGLSNRSLNFLKAANILTVGEVLSYWSKLSSLKLPSRKNGLGVNSVKEIHAATFAWLCDNKCIKKLAV